MIIYILFNIKFFILGHSNGRLVNATCRRVNNIWAISSTCNRGRSDN